RVIDLQLDDDSAVAVPRKDVGQRGHVEARELVRRSRANWTGTPRRPFERPIVVDDDDTVSGHVDVEFQTVGPQREPLVERRDRVLWRKRAAAAVREDQRARSGEKLTARFG